MAPLSQTGAYIALLLSVVLWGSYPATAKLALADFPPFILGTFRCFLAAILLTALLGRRVLQEIQTLRGSDLWSLGFLAMTGVFVSNGVTYLAIYLTTASNTVLLQATMPAMVAVGARVYLGERLRPLQWVGVLCSAAGVLLVVTKGEWAALRPANLQIGDFLVLAAMFAWSVNTVYGKRALTIYSPAVATIAGYMFTFAVLLPLAVATLPLFPRPHLTSPTAWGVVLYHAIPGALAHVWWYEAVRAVGPSRSAIFINFQPVVGVLLATTLLGETIGPAQLLGGLAVLIGVALTTRPVSARRR